MCKSKWLTVALLGFLTLGCRNSPDIAPSQETEKTKIVDTQDSKPPQRSPKQDLKVTPDDSAPPALLLDPNEGLTSQKKRFRIKNLEGEAKPVAYTYTDLQFIVSKLDGTPAGSVEIEKIEVWMKTHGHGLGSYEPVIKQDAENKFLISVSEIFFIMPGPWEINLTLQIDGQEDFIEYPIEVLD